MAGECSALALGSHWHFLKTACPTGVLAQFQGSHLPLPCSQCEEELLVGTEEVGSITLGQYLRQLARHQNFLWFVGMDLVQVWGAVPCSWAGLDLLQGMLPRELGIGFWA